VNYTGDDRPKAGKNWSELYHEIPIKDAEKFYKTFLNIGLRFSQKNVPVYVWHASNRYQELRDACKSIKIIDHQQIIWVKPCILLTYSVYPWRHEPCLFGWPQGNKPHFTAAANKSGGTIWDISFLRSGDPASPEYYSDVWEIDYEGKGRPPAGMHPTVKPTEIFAIPMRVHTDPGDVCYEPFSGSGSQIIAAERVRRRCYAIEIEPVFCDVAVKRWEDFTGKKARLIKTKRKQGGRAR